MPTYEAVINLTATTNASNPDKADQAFLGELTKRLLEVASRDNKFKLWVAVEEIQEMEDDEEED
jgi:hypothetical protein